VAPEPTSTSPEPIEAHEFHLQPLLGVIAHGIGDEERRIARGADGADGQLLRLNATGEAESRRESKACYQPSENITHRGHLHHLARNFRITAGTAISLAHGRAPGLRH
jgi:hypothetical protein